jgi:hypothetical protein
MNSKKLASIVVLIAAILLLVLILQTLGDKTYERNKYAKPVDTTHVLTEEERAALEQELYDAQVNAQWQTTKLATLRGTKSSEVIDIWKAQVAKSKAGLSKALKDAYSVSENAVKKSDIPFVQKQKIIADEKKQIDALLAEWKKAIDSGNPPSTQTVNTYLEKIQDYLEDVRDVIDTLTPENSGLTQEQIDEYKKEIQESISEVESTVTVLDQAQADVAHAEEVLNVQEHVGDPQAIEEQTHEVIEAQAEVADLKDKIDASKPPVEIFIPEPFDPNIKIIPLFDPSKPHLLQD